MREGRPPALAKAPCSRGAVVPDRVHLEELAAGGDLDAVADDRDLHLTAGVTLADPVAGDQRTRHRRRSRPCGSPTGRPSPGADGAASPSPSERALRSPSLADAAERGWRRARLGGGSDTSPLATDTSTVSPAEPRPDRIQLGGEADLAGPADPPSRRRLLGRLDRLSRLRHGEAESFPRHHVADPLMGTLDVVLVHPPIQLRLRVGD